MGGELTVLVFIVVIIGGLGSVGGCFVGALLVAMVAELRRLSGAEAGAGLQHPADGADPAVAAARAVSGDEAMSLPMKILSGDPPRSRVLAAILVVIIAALALTPFVFPGAKAMDVAAKICVFIVLVACYDLLLGYTGIVSFAHTMFFGIGGYGVAIALSRWGRMGRGRARHGRRRGAGARRAGARDRPVFAAGGSDLLCHDHAGGGRLRAGPGLATVRSDRRRGRPQLPAAECC